MRSWMRIITVASCVALVGLGMRLWRGRKTDASFRSYDVTTLASYDNIVPIAILGSGPGGLAAALYGARGGVDTVVFEGSQAGGQLMTTTWVENWPARPRSLGPDLITALKEQSQEFGAVYVGQDVQSVDMDSWPYRITTSDGTVVHALSCIVATGARARTLGVPGENMYWSRGVTTCAVCDAPFFKDKDVVVVGGGDSAFEEALQLAPYAKTITILVRRDVLRASHAMQERVAAYDSIRIQYNTQIKEIHGNEETVTHLTILQEGEEKQIPIDGVFLAIGHDPATDLVRPKVTCDANNYIVLKERTQATNVPGVFAAGDVADSVYRQAGVAAGDGIRAGMDALAFLRDIGYNEQVAREREHAHFVPEGGKERKPLEQLASSEEASRVLAQAEKDGTYVVFDFYTDVCTSCLAMLPHLESVHYQYGQRVAMYKINALENAELAEKYDVARVPTLVCYKGDTVVARVEKALSQEELERFFKRIIEG